MQNVSFYIFIKLKKKRFVKLIVQVYSYKTQITIYLARKEHGWSKSADASTGQLILHCQLSATKARLPYE